MAVERGLSRRTQDNARRILGGDVAVTVVNEPMDVGTLAALGEIGALSRVVELRSTARAESASVSRRVQSS